MRYVVTVGFMGSLLGRTSAEWRPGELNVFNNSNASAQVEHVQVMSVTRNGTFADSRHGTTVSGITQHAPAVAGARRTDARTGRPAQNPWIMTAGTGPCARASSTT